MPTSIGTNIITSLSRHIIDNSIGDNAYTNSNAFWFRLVNGGRKRRFTGGTQYEKPIMISKFGNGGAYEAYEVLDTSPNDTVINASWDPKGYQVPVTVDNFTIAKWNTELAAANGLAVLWEQASMHLTEQLGVDTHSDGTTVTKKVDGTKGAIDDAGVLTTYAGISRSTYTNWRAQDDSTSATLTLSVMRTMMSNCTKGGHGPSIIFTRKEQYNRLWTLLQANQLFNAAQDVALGSAGFKHIFFDGVPVVIDDSVFDGPNTSNGAVLFVDESAWQIVIWNGDDFQMQEPMRPHDQFAWVGYLTWMGNIVCDRPQTQGKLTNISA